MSGPPVDTPLQPPERPKRRPWVKVSVILGSIVAVLLVVAMGSAVVVYMKLGQIKVIDAPTAAAPAPDKPVNILLMGSDSRSGKGNDRYGKDAGRGGARSDTTILLHISADRSRALALSIPRDLWVKQPSCANPDKVANYYYKFNNAFDAGGAACTTQAVQDLTGVPVHHIAVVDFAGFKQVVDALGGVEVCLNEPVNDDHARLYLPAGKTVVTGNTALAFVRARYSLGDGSDIGRIQRQQAFLSSAIRKVTDTQMLLNPAKVYSVLDTATKALTVDKSLDSLSAMRQLVDSVRGLKPANITFVTMPFTYRSDMANVDPDMDKAQPILNAMKDDTQWPPAADVGADGKKLTVSPGDVSVRVVNSSGGTVSTARVTRELKAAGFQISQTSQSKRTESASRVVYDTADAEAARTLGYATNAVLVRDSGAGSLTLQVGKDYNGVKTNIVVAKPKAPADTGGSPTSAGKVVCAG